MENAEASAENGPQHNNPTNIYVDLNNPKLLQIVRKLRDELQNVKRDNHRILELSEYLLDIMTNQEKDKKSAIKTDSETTIYKHKGKRAKYTDSETSSEIKPSSCREIQIYISDNNEGDRKHRRKKYKPYKEIFGEFKKIKPPTFNEEEKKGEEYESWISKMKKYFQIYNYSDILKAIMAIYNLTRKADIWWQDIKMVKNMKDKYLTWRVFKK